MHLSPLQFLARTTPAWLDRQVTDPRSPHCGAWIDPTTALPNSGHVGTGAMLTATVWLALWGAPAQRARHWERALLAAAHLRRAQRRSGLIDLPGCNWDSAPDTAFLVQLLCAVIERTTDHPAPAAQRLRRDLLAFVRRALPGLATGGFHTPNHRWVVASALAWAATLTGDHRGERTLRAYLAEGVDQDADGAYQERSPAVYDAVANRSFLLLARHAGWAAGRRAVERNLALTATLLDADGTIESLQSRRQDRAWRIVPASLAAIAFELGRTDSAAWLWQKAEAPTLGDALWLLFAQTAATRVPAPLPRPTTDPHAWEGARRLRSLGLARARAGAWSLSAFTERAELLRVGPAALGLRAVSVALPYFGVGQCHARKIDARGAALTLTLHGLPHPRRPGYELPIGRPVPVERWEETLLERQLRRLPAIGGTLTARLARDGVTLALRTQGALRGIPVQLALDFEPGVQFRIAGRWRRPRAGEVFFLPAGTQLTARRGAQTWTLGPGADAHRINPMRDAWAPSDTVRVIVALAQPAAHTLRLRGR
jgi:hypothetical protein